MALLKSVVTKYLVHKNVFKGISLPEIFLLIPNSIKYDSLYESILC